MTPLDEHERYKKGVKKDAPKAKTFRKGACENCGAMTHKKKDCVERPRKLGAVHTKTDIAPDEYVMHPFMSMTIWLTTTLCPAIQYWLLTRDDLLWRLPHLHDCCSCCAEYSHHSAVTLIFAMHGP